MEHQTLLSVRNLRAEFGAGRNACAAVDGLSFDVERGGTLGIVGESGSGKTLTSLSILRLLPERCRIADGSSIVFDGKELTSLKAAELRGIRGREIAMIFQDPMMSLDPVYTAGRQIVEAIRAHEDIGMASARDKALRLLESVGIPSPVRVFESYPFELSGGMCQRVMIAIALSCGPKLLIADEPTTALDVTVQAQILDLLKKRRRESGMGLIMITHDLDVVAEMADRIIVMYAGKVMEDAPRLDVFQRPRHPYTAGLIRSIPRIDVVDRRLHTINGVVPDLRTMPIGCRFSTRCPLAESRCVQEEPPMAEVEPGHSSRCWKPYEAAAGAGNA